MRPGTRARSTTRSARPSGPAAGPGRSRGDVEAEAVADLQPPDRVERGRHVARAGRRRPSRGRAHDRRRERSSRRRRRPACRRRGPSRAPPPRRRGRSGPAARARCRCAVRHLGRRRPSWPARRPARPPPSRRRAQSTPGRAAGPGLAGGGQVGPDHHGERPAAHRRRPGGSRPHRRGRRSASATGRDVGGEGRARSSASTGRPPYQAASNRSVTEASSGSSSARRPSSSRRISAGVRAVGVLQGAGPDQRRHHRLVAAPQRAPVVAGGGEAVGLVVPHRRVVRCRGALDHAGRAAAGRSGTETHPAPGRAARGPGRGRAR